MSDYVKSVTMQRLFQSLGEENMTKTMQASEPPKIKMPIDPDILKIQTEFEAKRESDKMPYDAHAAYVAETARKLHSFDNFLHKMEGWSSNDVATQATICAFRMQFAEYYFQDKNYNTWESNSQ